MINKKITKESLLKLGELFIAIGIANWEWPNASNPKEVKVYINLLELKHFCIPDKKEDDMIVKIAEMIKINHVEIEEPVKGNNPQAGYFVRIGVVSLYEEQKIKKRNAPIESKSISFYTKVSKLNKNDLANCEDKFTLRLSEIITRQRDKDVEEQLRKASSETTDK